MNKRVLFVFCVLLSAIDIEAFVRRDVATTQTPMRLIEAFHENIDQFRQCIDQTFARTVGEINEKQLQPVFYAISDHLGRVSKAFEDLTAPRSTQEPPPEV